MIERPPAAVVHRPRGRSCTLNGVNPTLLLSALLAAPLLAACRSTALLPMDPAARGAAETPHIVSLGEHGEGTAVPAISELDFLVGRWEGEAFGGWAEENWAPARGGTMLGSFRLVKDDAPVFYELMVLVELEGRPQIRVKHFGPRMEP